MAPTRVSVSAALTVTTLLLAACGDDPATVGAGGRDASVEPPTGPADEAVGGPVDEAVVEPPVGDDLFPDVLDAVITPQGDGSFTVDATLSSPYDSPERYADAWRVLDPEGTVLGVRELLHDHAGEQPFTRSLSGVVIGDDVAEVTIEGRDQLNGWGGATVAVEVPTS
jgi:hypothetical protein